MERLTVLAPGSTPLKRASTIGQERHANGQEDHLRARLGVPS
jgi:hypothetical protein